MPIIKQESFITTRYTLKANFDTYYVDVVNDRIVRIVDAKDDTKDECIPYTSEYDKLEEYFNAIRPLKIGQEVVVTSMNMDKGSDGVSEDFAVMYIGTIGRIVRIMEDDPHVDPYMIKFGNGQHINLRRQDIRLF